MDNMKKNKGMTLIEVIIAMSILGIIMATTYMIFINNSKHLWRIEDDTKLQNEAQIISSTFSQLGMQTKGILGSSEVSEINGYEGYLVRKLKLEQNNGKEMIWEVMGNELILTIEEDEGNKQYTLSENLESFKINPIDSDKLEDARSVSIDITLHKKKGFNDLTYPISTIVTFRNK